MFLFPALSRDYYCFFNNFFSFRTADFLLVILWEHSVNITCHHHSCDCQVEAILIKGEISNVYTEINVL
jgi:hypothetical protein